MNYNIREIEAKREEFIIRQILIILSTVFLNIKYYCLDLKSVIKKINVNFDVIILNFALQDIKDYKEILKQLRKCITQNGKLIITIEHPFFGKFDEFHVTTSRDWIDYRNQINNQLDSLERYIKIKKIKINWNNELSTISYSRTLQEYTSALFSANFSISRILEPISFKQLAKLGPKNNLSYLSPMFMIIEAYPFNSII